MFDKNCKYHQSCGADMCHGEGICKDFERGQTHQHKTEKKADKLLPCPFCGGEAEIKECGNVVIGWKETEIRCKRCNTAQVHKWLRYKFDYDFIIKKTIEAWNRRAT